MKRVLLSVLTGAAVVAAAGTASAQSFNFEHFQPMPSQRTNTLNVARSEVLEHFNPAVGLMFHFQDDPLQLTDADGTYRLMDDHLKAELAFTMGFFDFADLGVVVPMALYQKGEAVPAHGFEGISGFAMSDIRVVPKFRLFHIAGFGGAILVPMSLPTGDGDTFNSDGGFGAEPRVALDWVHENGLKFAANVGYLLRPNEQTYNFASGQTLKWSAGTEVPLGTPTVRAVGSIFGSYGIEDGRDPTDLEEAADNAKARPIEGLLGVNIELPADLMLQIGGGAGLNGGVGSPDFRVFTGIEWSPRDKDTDQDGLMDSEDGCPEKPEDRDGWEDSDGCPDTDNDGDNILDEDDQCPDDAEDVDTFEDKNGCPDPDNDKDGVLDDDDACPLEAGPVENKGCPWGDKDKDGILDNKDSCPDEPEDKDGFQDDDGCPDPDNDEDGILDAVDQCPLEPETINGNKDEDGCPDKGKTKVVITAEKIDILEKVYFNTNKAKIQKRSYNLLDQVASVLKAHPEVKIIRVEGHTDSRGRDSKNLKLSKRRAESVRTYLVKQGIEEGRLTSEGFGETVPIDDNNSKTGRANNRRVEFKIIEVEGEVRVKEAK